MTSHPRAMTILAAKGGPLAAAALAIALGTVAIPAVGQYAPPSSYSDYYLGNWENNLRPPLTPGQYTFDKYFYQRPTVSPYLNLLRPRQGVLPNYQTLVVPEEQRRAGIGANPSYQTGVMAMSGGVGGGASYSAYEGREGYSVSQHYHGGAGTLGTRQTSRPAATSPGGFMSTYYSHWYGGGYGR